MDKRYRHQKLHLLELESRISKHDYFSRDCLPGYIDAIIFDILEHKYQIPDKDSFPNLFHWFVNIKQFSPKERASWSAKANKLNESDWVMQLIAQIQSTGMQAYLECQRKLSLQIPEPNYQMSRNDWRKKSSNKDENKRHNESTENTSDEKRRRYSSSSHGFPLKKMKSTGNKLSIMVPAQNC